MTGRMWGIDSSLVQADWGINAIIKHSVCLPPGRANRTGSPSCSRKCKPGFRHPAYSRQRKAYRNKRGPFVSCMHKSRILNR
jgi:hypothetical protein